MRMDWSGQQMSDLERDFVASAKKSGQKNDVFSGEGEIFSTIERNPKRRKMTE